MKGPELTPRRIFLAIFLACVGLIGFALYLQHVEVLEPCPMCILQRYAFIAVALVAAVAAVHGPRGPALTLYGGLIALFAVLGGGVAAWHSWLQRFPPPSLSCGTDLWYLLDTFPLAKALPVIFQGTGECTEVQWRFLGLSIPEWALVWFAIFLVAAVVAVVRGRRAASFHR